MNIVETGFNNCLIIQNNTFIDDRGTFNKYYDKSEFSELGFDFDIKQVNHSINLKKGTFRGLHYQNGSENEAKIIKCIKGSIIDYAVDLRTNSDTYLQYFSINLNEKESKMLLIPNGFAHGFLTLEDNSEILYLHNGNYSKQNDAGIKYDDLRINLKLPFEVEEISEKDFNLPLIKDDFKGF